MNPNYSRIAERARHRCEFCRAPEAINNFPFEVEHVIPTSQEGTNEDSNLALACRSCNVFKRDYVVELDIVTNQLVSLFHPRNDNWETHFFVDAESGVILGLSPTGRVTIVRLRMNSSRQVTARLAWSRLGLFP